MEYQELKECAKYSNLRTSTFTKDTYISTENMLPNKGGVTSIDSIPTCKTMAKYEPADILISNIRPYFCKIWFATREGGCSNDVLVIKTKKELYPRFLYYVLSDKNFFNYATITSKGTKMPRGNKNAIMKYLVPKISPVTQQKIASILSVYDRLIESNTRRIRLLEQMAENLYKEWFVRFRFPEHENVEMVNGLPKGWNKKGLGNIADVCMGSSPKSEYYNDEKRGLPFHQGVGSFGERFVLDNTYSTSYSQIAEPMSILFSVRAPVGRLNYTRNRIVIGRGVAAINHKEGMQSLLFYTLKAKFFKEDIIGNGAIFSSITKKELLKLKLIVANKELRVVFNNKINKIDREIDILYKQNQLLTRQRDLLLPRLMSGKLEVKS